MVVGEWAKTDPQAAADMATKLPGLSERGNAFISIAIEWGRQGDLPQAERLIQQGVDDLSNVSTFRDKSLLLWKAGVLTARMRSWHAAHEIARLNTSEEDRLYILTTILYEWSRRDQPLNISWEVKEKE